MSRGSRAGFRYRLLIIVDRKNCPDAPIFTAVQKNNFRSSILEFSRRHINSGFGLSD